MSKVREDMDSKGLGDLGECRVYETDRLVHHWPRTERKYAYIHTVHTYYNIVLSWSSILHITSHITPQI